MQRPLEWTQETAPELLQNPEYSTDNTDKMLQNWTKKVDPINHKLCNTQGIEEIPWWQGEAKQVPLPLEVPETYKSTARMLGLFKQTTLNAAKPKNWHKKGIKVPANGMNYALTPPGNPPSPLPGLEYLEGLEDKDPIMEPKCIIVENHDIEWWQEAQKDMLELNQARNRPVQRDVKHGLSDPYT